MTIQRTSAGHMPVTEINSYGSSVPAGEIRATDVPTLIFLTFCRQKVVKMTFFWCRDF